MVVGLSVVVVDALVVVVVDALVVEVVAPVVEVLPTVVLVVVVVGCDPRRGNDSQAKPSPSLPSSPFGSLGSASRTA